MRAGDQAAIDEFLVSIIMCLILAGLSYKLQAAEQQLSRHREGSSPVPLTERPRSLRVVGEPYVVPSPSLDRPVRQQRPNATTATRHPSEMSVHWRSSTSEREPAPEGIGASQNMDERMEVSIPGSASNDALAAPVA